MKKYFTTGLAILLPIVFTGMIVGILINFLTKPFLTHTKALLVQWSFFQESIFFNEAAFLTIISKIVILCALSSAVILIGWLGQWFLIDALFRFGNYILHRLPFVNKIYKACQDIVQTIFSPSSRTFSQVVLVPFPNHHSLSIGLITSHSLNCENIPETEQTFSVFIPGTPNPTVGFMLMLKKEQLIFVDMKVDEAMKFIVSCGVVMPEFKMIEPSLSFYEQHPRKSQFLSSEEQFNQNPLDLCQSSRSTPT